MPESIDALFAFAAAAAIAWLLVPVAEAFAWRIGAIDLPGDRSLHVVPTPRLSGIAILVAVCASGAIFLPWDDQTRAILLGAVVIAMVGMADDIFGFHIDWVETFAQRLSEADGVVPFTIQTRADLTSDRMAAALARAGCSEAWIGAESGSQRILDRMTKGTQVAEVIAARQRLAAHGIRVGFFIQLGYLGEELDDILATRELVECARPDDVGVSVAYPLPGTKFHELVGAQLGEKTNWLESNDLDMMFTGTYRSEFYRIVRDLLHDQVAHGQSPALQRRWDELVMREATYRQARDVCAIVGPLAAGAAT